MDNEIKQDFIESEIYKMTVFNVKNMFKSVLGDIVNVDEMKLYQHQSFMELVIPFRSQVMVQDMTDKLESLMKLRILYAAKSLDTKIYKVMAYSTPVENDMYIVFLDSLQYGIAESITVHVFDSIETMLFKVQSYKKSVSLDKNMKMLDSQSYKEMLKEFIN